MESNFMDNYNNISGISPEKLNLLSEIIRQSENVSSENLIPFFLNAAATANAKGIISQMPKLML